MRQSLKRQGKRVQSLLIVELEAIVSGGCIALGIVTILYLLLSFCIAELASYNPKAGGPYTFAADLLGKPLGFLTGLAESLNVIVTTAVIAVGISSYMVTSLLLQFFLHARFFSGVTQSLIKM